MKWPSQLLGDFAVIRGGSVDPAKAPTEEFELYSIPAFDTGKPEIAKGSEIGSSKKIVQTNDVLISRIVPHIRRSWVVGVENQRRLIASGEWIVFRSAEFWPEYLRHYLLSDPFHLRFMQTVSGVGGSLLRARPAEVYKIRVPIPPIEEQKRIAGILDAADELRKKRRESIAQIDTLLQSTFLDMFGDPVTNPKGWDRIDYNEAVNDMTSKASKILKTDYLPEGSWPIIDQSQNSIAGYSNEERPYEHPLPVVIFGDHTRNLKYMDKPFLLGADGAKILSPKQDYLGTTVLFLLKLFRIPDLGYSRHMKEVKRLRFPKIPMELQYRFHELWMQVENMKEMQRLQSSELDTLFASLQSRAFKGELS